MWNNYINHTFTFRLIQSFKQSTVNSILFIFKTGKWSCIFVLPNFRSRGIRLLNSCWRVRETIWNCWINSVRSVRNMLISTHLSFLLWIANKKSLRSTFHRQLLHFQASVRIISCVLPFIFVAIWVAYQRARSSWTKQDWYNIPTCSVCTAMSCHV